MSQIHIKITIEQSFIKHIICQIIKLCELVVLPVMTQNSVIATVNMKFTVAYTFYITLTFWGAIGARLMAEAMHRTTPITVMLVECRWQQLLEGSLDIFCSS